MTNMNQQPTSQTSLSGKFRDELNELRLHSRSFATCVRMEYEAVEQAIYDGVPLELIAQKLAEVYGVQGTLSAFKSALSRIRRTIDGDVCKRWLDERAPLPAALGGASVNAAPPMTQGQPNPGAPVLGVQPDVHPAMHGVQLPYIYHGSMPAPLPFGTQPVPYGAQPPYGMQVSNMPYPHPSVPMSGLGGYQRSI
jgi:hypothetical protein